MNCDGHYGVLYVAPSQKVTCATCRFGKVHCVHIQYLSDLCANTDIDLPEVLKEYAQLLSQIRSPCKKQYSDYSCISKERIPFEITSNMCAALCMPNAERFNMSNNVAQLIPKCTCTVCSHCNQIYWGDPYFSNNATIVTPNQLVQAKGKFSPCHVCTLLSTCFSFNVQFSLENV